LYETIAILRQLASSHTLVHTAAPSVSPGFYSYSDMAPAGVVSFAHAQECYSIIKLLLLTLWFLPMHNRPSPHRFKQEVSRQQMLSLRE
jgi:hypothetical protein